MHVYCYLILFYFFVLQLIAMTYNWRCMYVNSTYLLTFLL